MNLAAFLHKKEVATFAPSYSPCEFLFDFTVDGNHILSDFLQVLQKKLHRREMSCFMPLTSPGFPTTLWPGV